jgi:outer membrane receptor protein involved in Fe transport
MFTRGVTLDISEVEFPFANQAQRKTPGVDLQVRSNLPLSTRRDFFGEAASQKFSLVGTSVFENSIKLDPATGSIDCVGHFAASFSEVCPTFMTPDERVNFTLSYENTQLITALTWKWIGAAKNAILLDNDPTIITGIPSIGSYYYLDLSARYTFNDKIELRGGISNLLEEEPPLLAPNGSQANTNPQIYDVFGRWYFIGLTFSLKQAYSNKLARRRRHHPYRVLQEG